MAHSNVTCAPGAPQQLTTSVAAARVHNPGGFEAWLQATATSTPPANRQGAIRLLPGSTLAADLPLAQLFPGIGAGAMFLWAFVDNAQSLSVSHV